jgi:hypothetical protein
MPESDNRYWTYFDEAWKKIIERFFPQFLRFFVAELHRDVDFSKPFTFLDKEMEQLSQRTRLKGSKFVDKLVKVFLKDGNEQWLLIHVEVQGAEDKEFSLRMFRYFYRIFDRHGQPVVSIAILTGSTDWLPSNQYRLKAYGSGVEFGYLAFKLMDYPTEQLEADDNPMALVVLAAQERERVRRMGSAYDAKWRLVRKLYEKGYTRQEILDLFEFNSGIER